jgi:hypothetical protein
VLGHSLVELLATLAGADAVASEAVAIARRIVASARSAIGQ